MTITLPAGARQGDGRQKIAVEGERDKIGGAKAPVRGARLSAGFPLLGPAAERAEAGATEFWVDIESVAVPCRVSAGRWTSRYDRSPAGVRPHILIHPETCDARQPGRSSTSGCPRGGP